jgi:hypothetical protein
MAIRMHQYSISESVAHRSKGLWSMPGQALQFKLETKDTPLYLFGTMKIFQVAPPSMLIANSFQKHRT